MVQRLMQMKTRRCKMCGIEHSFKQKRPNGTYAIRNLCSACEYQRQLSYKKDKVSLEAKCEYYRYKLANVWLSMYPASVVFKQTTLWWKHQTNLK